MELGGKLTGPLLSALAGTNLCLLEADQLRQISPESIRHAEKLDISSCSQGKKDILYETARSAFASQEGTSAYYPLIQPYLGGAPVEDLKKLARSQVAMDINTFTNLKPEELKALSVQDVKDLLGVHLTDLKDAEAHPSVALWIRSHFQSELDTLGIGLRGGMMAPPSTTSTAAGASGATKPHGTSIAVAPAISSAASAGSAGSVATISGVNAATFSGAALTGLSPSTLATAVDSHTAPPSEATLTAGETSTPLETTNTALPTVSIHPKAAIPTTVRAPVASTATDISTTAAAHHITANGTILPAVARGINLTPSVNTTAAPNYITTNETIVPTVATHMNVTTSVNTRAASSNVTSNGTVLPTIATHTNVIGTTSNITHTSYARVSAVSASATMSTTPNVTVSASSERPSAPPIPLSNATTLVYLSTAMTASEELPAASSRTTARGAETPHETSLPAGPGPLRTTIAAASKRGTTRTAPPKAYPTPNGYINVRPLSASASSLSLSCLLLMPSLAVGLSVLRRLF
ncbi:mucin-5B-like [Eublepharis macularius]|uniref:Mucin-5B-like n=1 Tax=Eublepharis macularius TaxID=481883 RepID=A0AA97K2Q8_EUBMA|nr:mucin-5B-like [Eublepharis macularius]